MEKKYEVEIDGHIHRLSERAIQILKIKKRTEKPVEVLKMPQKFDVIKVEPKIEPKAEPVAEKEPEVINKVREIKRRKPRTKKG